MSVTSLRRILPCNSPGSPGAGEESWHIGAECVRCRWQSSQFGDAVKHSGKRANRRIAAGLLWIGPGELVLSDLARAGRIQAGVVLIALAALFAALTRDAAVSLGVRAAIDAVVRLAVLPVEDGRVAEPLVAGEVPWTLTTLCEKLIKIGAKVVHHAKAVTFQLAEVAVPRALFAAILGRIGRLRAAPIPG